MSSVTSFAPIALSAFGAGIGSLLSSFVSNLTVKELEETAVSSAAGSLIGSSVGVGIEKGTNKNEGGNISKISAAFTAALGSGLRLHFMKGFNPYLVTSGALGAFGLSWAGSYLGSWAGRAWKQHHQSDQ
jgi:uncharacterized membrane protein YjjB (DUF3815 family)